MKLHIVAHPNSKNPRIETDLLGTVHIYVNAPPLEGKANREIVEPLAKHLNIKKSKLILKSGQRGKYKIFEVIQ